jgi:predicted P-loop ATPase
LSRTDDHFRPPYGRRVITSPRQCSFFASINNDQYLKDETGGRRFLPVRTTVIDLEALYRDRDQLWAEASHLYKDGCSWWIKDPKVLEAAKDEQSSRYIGDAWDEAIAEYVATRNEVTIAEIFTGALGIAEKSKWGQTECCTVLESARVGAPPKAGRHQALVDISKIRCGSG